MRTMCLLTALTAAIYAPIAPAAPPSPASQAARRPSAPATRPAASVEALLAQLKSPDANKVEDALEAIAKLAPAHADQIVPALIDAMAAAKLDEIRQNVGGFGDMMSETIGRFGASARPFMPQLLELVGLGQFELAELAIETAKKIGGEEDDRIIPRALKETRDPEARTRAAAVVWLARCPLDQENNARAEAALAHTLADPSSLVRRYSLYALGRFFYVMGHSDNPVGPGVAAFLRDKDPVLRAKAAEVLENIRADQPSVLEALIKATGDGEAKVRGNVLETLAAWPGGQVPASLRDDLIRLVRGADWDLACRIVSALKQQNDTPLGQDMVPVLCELLGRTDRANDQGLARLQYAAADSLGDMVGGHPQVERRRAGGFQFCDPLEGTRCTTEKEITLVRDALIRALGRPDLASPAAASLARLGPRAARAVAALRKAMLYAGRPDQVAAALGSLGPAAAEAVPELLGALRSTDQDLRKAAAEALRYIAPQSKEVAAAMIPLLGEGTDDWSPLANSAEWALGAGGQAALDQLVPALDSANVLLARRAASVLGGFGAKAEQAIPGLTRLLASKDAPTRATAAGALEAIGSKAAPAIPQLMKLLQDEDRVVRGFAARALGAIGPPAAARDPLLRMIAAQDDESWTALEAIRKMGLDQKGAVFLSSVRIQDDHAWVGGSILDMLIDFPDQGLAFLKANPKAVGSAGLGDLCELADDARPASAALRKAIFDSPLLPAEAMAWTGDARYLSVLHRRMEKAKPYERIRLLACARACGEKPDRVIHISERHPVDFRPPSSLLEARGDPTRKPPNFFGNHGDGVTTVVVTGRMIMPDGSPARAPVFYDSTKPMLWGPDPKSRIPVKYDPKTGRFLFVLDVFAAYAVGVKDDIGPYETGPGEVHIEAQGAKPFTFTFYDEMPHTEITLTPAPAGTKPK